MDKSKLKENIFKTLSEKLSGSTSLLQLDLKKLASDLSQSIISRYNLVTDEELQTQKKILEKAQQKLNALEKRIQELESNMK